VHDPSLVIPAHVGAAHALLAYTQSASSQRVLSVIVEHFETSYVTHFDETHQHISVVLEYN